MTTSGKHTLRQAIAKMPIVGTAAKKLYRKVVRRPPDLRFRSSPQYWEDRYAARGNSGAGSYGRLAQFKAAVINDFIARNAIQTVIEFGCGDGAQLKLGQYPYYTGIDVSRHAIDLCKSKFRRDPNKRFFHTSGLEAQTIRADMAMSLDVIYHLVEDQTYHAYMVQLTSAAERFICIYSSDEERPGHVAHIRHRCFTNWLATHAPHWRSVLKVPNPYPEDSNRPDDTSWADFHFFARSEQSSSEVHADRPAWP
jgi:hypothetical protein